QQAAIRLRIAHCLRLYNLLLAPNLVMIPGSLFLPGQCQYGTNLPIGVSFAIILPWNMVRKTEQHSETWRFLARSIQTLSKHAVYRLCSSGFMMSRPA